MQPDFNPARVMLGQNPSKPYIDNKPSGLVQPPAVHKPVQRQPQANPTLGAEAVRATGSGPFDAAYRQNLATYSGGQFQRPGGELAFNPTGALFGNPVGGGNAPVLGMPNDLLGQALTGGAFKTPQAKPAEPNPHRQPGDWKFWLDRFGQQGRLLRNY